MSDVSHWVHLLWIGQQIGRHSMCFVDVSYPLLLEDRQNNWGPGYCVSVSGETAACTQRYLSKLKDPIGGSLLDLAHSRYTRPIHIAEQVGQTAGLWTLIGSFS